MGRILAILLFTFICAGFLAFSSVPEGNAQSNLFLKKDDGDSDDKVEGRRQIFNTPDRDRSSSSKSTVRTQGYTSQTNIRRRALTGQQLDRALKDLDRPFDIVLPLPDLKFRNRNLTNDDIENMKAANKALTQLAITAEAERVQKLAALKARLAKEERARLFGDKNQRQARPQIQRTSTRENTLRRLVNPETQDSDKPKPLFNNFQ